MKNQKICQSLIFAVIFFAFALTCFGQNLLKRTTYKTETFDLGAGGTVTLTGAPYGSVTIEGWNKNEIEVSAEIEIQAATRADLDKLSTVNGFIMDESFNHLRIISVGTHDKQYIKKNFKKLPKNLLEMPFKIDFKIKLPRFCDLNIDGGVGNFVISGVDGNMRINFVKGDAKMSLEGGAIQAIFGNGNVEISIPTRSWRGRFADIQLISGTMNVFLPLSLNAQIDANILRSGQIENTFAELKPRERNALFTDKVIVGKSGIGGVPLSFKVGDGTLKISQIKN
jgi:hypothetical protein